MVPDLVYAKGVPDTPSPDPSTFDRMKCNLILVETGLCKDFRCNTRHQENAAKYAPLVNALETIWGRWNL
jgi:hypothetical protein